MSKILYITDQDEYADHSFIGPLFQKYLTKHFDINTTFFSNTKNEIEFEEKGRIIIPKKFQNNILIIETTVDVSKNIIDCEKNIIDILKVRLFFL